VFDDAGPSAIASSSARAPKAVPSGSASSAIVTQARPPGDLGCVETSGQPEAIRRTVGRPACRASEVLEWRDPSGAPRYACLYSPPELSKREPLPLVVFFHGSTPGLDDPTSVPKLTSLRSKLDAFDLTGRPSTKGFLLLAVQGRALGKGSDGASFDTAHVAADNLDKVTADRFVDVLLERGVADAKRVYAVGMGSGAEMAATYAMLRPDRVAAFGGFAPSTPPAVWQCPGPPPPGFVAYRACDSVVSCESVELWLRARDKLGAETKALRLGEDQREEPNCTPKNKCSEKKGNTHHLRWPKGREAELLRFLGSHALQ
jgi:dienelactone hydrolase